MDDLWMILMDDLWMIYGRTAINQLTFKQLVYKFDLWMILGQVSWFITRMIVGFMGGYIELVP